MTELLFFVEVVVAGLLAGTMYSLVALGFVLIYKASSTFNFAQGAMVFFCSFILCRNPDKFWPIILAYSYGSDNFNDYRWSSNRKVCVKTTCKPTTNYFIYGNNWFDFFS